jgi:homoserine dehydrogenase
MSRPTPTVTEAAPRAERDAVEHPTAEARVALFGLGGVGRAFLDLLGERPRGVSLVAAADSRGALVGELDAQDVLDRKAAGPLPASPGIRALVDKAGADVVLDLSACDFATAEPSLSILRAGLEAGTAVVTANKAPLARHWRELNAGADGARRIGYAAAAGAALPAVAVARTLARADDVRSFDAVLTGTTTFVLDAMAAGASAPDAVRAAQEEGIAEPDPSIDIGGWDTAAKLVILAHTLWDCDLGLDDVNVTGIEGADPSALRAGGVRLVGRAERRPGGVNARVSPVRLEPDHPLARLRGAEKGVVFRGADTGEVVVAGGRSHPRGAAAAALGDVLELMEDRA